jgi:hypothetical protein
MVPEALAFCRRSRASFGRLRPPLEALDLHVKHQYKPFFRVNFYYNHGPKSNDIETIKV